MQHPVIFLRIELQTNLEAECYSLFCILWIKKVAATDSNLTQWEHKSIMLQKNCTWSITDHCSHCTAAEPVVAQSRSSWFSGCVKESAVVLLCSRALILCFCWLMASHESAPVLLPSLWEGGGKRVMAPGGKRPTEVQRERERERESERETRVRIGKELARWKEEWCSDTKRERKKLTKVKR